MYPTVFGYRLDPVVNNPQQCVSKVSECRLQRECAALLLHPLKLVGLLRVLFEKCGERTTFRTRLVPVHDLESFNKVMKIKEEDQTDHPNFRQALLFNAALCLHRYDGVPADVPERVDDQDPAGGTDEDNEFMTWWLAPPEKRRRTEGGGGAAVDTAIQPRDPKEVVIGQIRGHVDTLDEYQQSLGKVNLNGFPSDLKKWWATQPYIPATELYGRRVRPGVPTTYAQKFPLLHRLVVDLECVPSSSVGIESLFSSAGLVAGVRKKHMRAELLEAQTGLLASRWSTLRGARLPPRESHRTPSQRSRPGVSPPAVPHPSTPCGDRSVISIGSADDDDDDDDESA